MPVPPPPPVVFESCEMAQISPLTGGHASRVYKCDKDETSYVLRFVNQQSAFEQEKAVLESIAPFKIGPTLIDTDPEALAFLLDYIPGKTLGRFSEKRLNDYIAAIQTLRIFHETPFDQGSQSTIHHRLYNKIIDTHLPLPLEMKIAYRCFLSIEQALKGFEQKLTHNDFHRHNVIISPDGPKLIDFTTASLGDPYFDLAKFLLFVPLPYKDKLLTAYHDRKMTPLERAHFNLMEESLLFLIALNRYVKSNGTHSMKPFSKISLEIFPSPADPTVFLNGALSALDTFLQKTNDAAFNEDLTLCLHHNTKKH